MLGMTVVVYSRVVDKLCRHLKQCRVSTRILRGRDQSSYTKSKNKNAEEVFNHVCKYGIEGKITTARNAQKQCSKFIFTQEKRKGRITTGQGSPADR